LLYRARPLRIALAGHVDHGKSTLVGRLLNDTGALSPEKIAAIKETCRVRNAQFEWAFVTDALQAERRQRITIDSSYARLKIDGRDCVIVDVPGHAQFLRNMATGVSGCDAALMVVDITEGLRDQSLRHIAVLGLIGVTKIIVAVTKMDSVAYSRAAYDALAAKILAATRTHGLDPLFIIPISAYDGENIGTTSTHMPWYRGPTVLAALAGLRAEGLGTGAPARLPVQAVYDVAGEKIVAGRIAGGSFAPGDRVVFHPSGTAARIQRIAGWSAPLELRAQPGESVGLVFDGNLAPARGELGALEAEPPLVGDALECRLFWFGDKPLARGTALKLRVHTEEVGASVTAIRSVVDPAGAAATIASEIGPLQIGTVTLHLARQIAFDPPSVDPHTARFILVDGYALVGCGTLTGFAGATTQDRLATAASS
jgi:bifunctional enzyme CysN/CysC